MNRRIIIELDAENADALVKDIMRMVTCRVAPDAEFSIRQELPPDRTAAIRVPEFLQRGCRYG